MLLESISTVWPDKLPTLHYFVKPSLLIILNLYFFLMLKEVKNKGKWMVQAALVFSLAGDVFLMFQQQKPFFFLLGLGSFLLAHLGYIAAFAKPPTTEKVNWKKGVLWFGLFDLLLLGGVVFTFIEHGLGPLFWPVVGYMLVILTMGFIALTRQERVSKESYRYVLIGALLFLASDSILALNKFNAPIPMAHFWIMIPYALAQLLIVKGIIKQYRD